MRNRLALVLLCSTSLHTQMASAQAVAAPATPAPAGKLEEVVVTAQRRRENIQKTSLAVTALSGAQLRERGVRDLKDLQNVTPSLTVSDAGLLSFANIRGVGINLQSATNVSGVALYRDGLFAPSPIFLNEGIFDIASVEVLRGPQGTFVGQNSTAGAIIQKSVSPTLGRTTGDAELSVGNYHFVKLEGGISFPLTDTIAVRLATDIEHRDSFYTNLGPAGDRPGRVEDQHGRISILWKPSSELSVLSKTEINAGNDGGYTFKPIPGTQFAPFQPSDPFTLDYDRPDLKLKQLSVRSGIEINYILPDGIDIRSISGIQYAKQDFINDEDASASPTAYSHQVIYDNTYNQEINVISPDRGPFKWVVGGSFVYQLARANLHFYNDTAPFNGAIFPIQDIFIDDANPKSATGVFAQGTYKITPDLTLELGGRYSHDRQTQEGGIYLLPDPPLPGFLNGAGAEYSDNKLTGKAALDWQITPTNLVYAFVANGFKSGGVNLPSGTFRPEKIIDYEAGWKPTFLDGHLRAQLDGFYMDYRDLQLDVFNPATTNTNIANVPRSTIYGSEASLQARLGAFSADGGLSYVHSALGSLRLINTQALPGGSTSGLGVQCGPGVPNGTGGCFNYTPYAFSASGNPNLYSPKWTINAGMQYAFDLPNNQTLTPRFDISHLSSQRTGLLPDTLLNAIGARTLLGVQAIYALPRFTITLYSQNLLNTTYRVGNYNNNFTYYGAPRQFGVRLSSSF